MAAHTGAAGGVGMWEEASTQIVRYGFLFLLFQGGVDGKDGGGAMTCGKGRSDYKGFYGPMVE